MEWGKSADIAGVEAPQKTLVESKALSGVIGAHESELAIFGRILPILCFLGGLIGVINSAFIGTFNTDDMVFLMVASAAVVASPILWFKRVRVSERIMLAILGVSLVALTIGTIIDTGVVGELRMVSMAVDAQFFVWFGVIASYYLSRRNAITVIACCIVSIGIVAAVVPMSFWPILGITLSSLVVTTMVVLRGKSRLIRMVEELANAARTDHLTGLPNRRVFDDYLQRELQRAERFGEPVSVLALDIDRFKQINDRFGHQAGDEILMLIANVITTVVRDADVPARMGGEEFAVLLPNTTLVGATIVGERLREAIELHFEDCEVTATTSIGVGSSPDHGLSAQQLMCAADTALYEAKATGRNRVVAFRPLDDTVGQSVAEAVDASIESMRNVSSLLDIAANVRNVVSGAELGPRDSRRVSEISAGIGRELGWSGTRCERLLVAGQLHDIGKAGIPLEILKKVHELSDEEWEIVRQSPVIGSHILEKHNLLEIATWIEGQHERYDGHGYPRGSKADDIPEGARILAVSQAYVAMTTDRPYRPALDPMQARQELLAAVGAQFDPVIVAAFVRWLWKHRTEWPAAA